MSLLAVAQPGSLLEAFTQEIQSLGGSVTDSIEHEGNLYVRSTLDEVREVRPGDRMRTGIALRATDEDIRVHPYLFRLVCRNGAIIAQATQTQVISLDDPTGNPIPLMCRAVRECALPQAFEPTIGEIRGAMEREADVMLLWLPLMDRIPPSLLGRAFQTIARRFAEGRDATRFGLMNAVTSTARDTRDPEVRWRLEELGAQVPALREEDPVLRETKRALSVPRDSLVTV